MVIHVLHIVGCMNRGGQETLLMNLFRNINRTKIIFDFVVQTYKECDYDKEILELGGKIYRIPAIYKNPFKRFIQLKNIVKKNCYKIIFRHSDKSIEWPDLLSAKLGGAKKLVYHSHNSNAKNYLLHKLFRPVMNFISNDKFACSYEAGKWMFGSKKFTIIKNAIDSRLFQFNFVLREQFSKKIGIENKFVIGHIGRFDKQKNHVFLIDVFYEISKMEPNVALLLIGNGHLENQIKKKVQTLEIQDKVHFLGIRSDINDIYSTMDIFLFPSNHEGFPLVSIEAQTNGLKIFCSDVISREIDISKTSEFISLMKRPSEWAEIILAYMKSYNVKNRKSFTNHSYDVRETIKQIENIIGLH
jgi:glycosyltransferase involved in cell wall biosynthesis